MNQPLFVIPSVLYWSDWGPEKPKIELAGMDGQNRSAILTSDLKWPHSLTIDFLGERLCWTDVRYHSIECSNYDGTQRKVDHLLSNVRPKKKIVCFL